MPGEKREGDNKFEMNIDLSLAEMFYSSCWQKEILPIVNSVTGSIISCSYEIEFFSETSGMFMCCGDSAKIKHPIFILPVFDESLPQILAPQGWNPLVYNLISFDFILAANEAQHDVDNDAVSENIIQNEKD